MELTREQITEKRERLGLSKSAFGRESGLHVSTISQIESGRLIPYPGQMKKKAIKAIPARLEPKGRRVIRATPGRKARPAHLVLTASPARTHGTARC